MAELVECHSGSGYADRPVAFNWEGQRMEIDRILAEWRTPEAKCFRVHTADGREFDLAYYHDTDEWQIEEH